MLKKLDKILLWLLIPAGIGFITLLFWTGRNRPVWLILSVTLYVFFFSIYVFIRNKQSGPSILKRVKWVKVEEEQKKEEHEKSDDE